MNPIAEHVTGLQHIGLPTNCMEDTLDFYLSLGFEVALRTADGDVTVCFLQLQNVIIEAYENGQAVGHPGAINHIALDVDDIEAAWEAARSAGLSIVEPEIRYLPFWENGVRFFNVLGPNQEIVEFSLML